MKTFLLVVVVGILTSCAKPPKLNISMSLDKPNPDVVFVKVKVINMDDRATVPINIEITGQAETNGQWDKSSTLLHPAAFVLNKKEQRDITKIWRVPAQAARATLVVKEQESGNLLKTERAEKVFSAPATTNP